MGIQKRPEVADNAHLSSIDYRINRRPSSLARVSDKAIDWERHIEYLKSSVRCKVEHVFRIIKCQFGYRKTVYRGLRKNENRLYAMFACANLYAHTPLPEPAETSLPPGKGHTAPFYMSGNDDSP